MVKKEEQEEKEEIREEEQKIDKKISEKQNKIKHHKVYHNKEKKHVEKKAIKKVHHKENKKINPKNIPSLQLKTEDDIAMDFAIKVYKKFNKIIKSIVLFGSTAKKDNTAGSDIDIIIIIDDVSIKWEPELVAWYREELDKILQGNPYKKSLHINTVKLSTWWDDLLRGDPVVINIIRYGRAMIDLAGFFEPLKFLLVSGKIQSTPEAVYNCLQRAPVHLARSKASELNAIEGLYWAMVDSAHAALISANVSPPSPEHIPLNLKETFVDAGKLNMKYIANYRDLLILHKKIAHGEIRDLKGVEIDQWQEKTEDFMRTMAQLVKNEIEKK
jgi:predicted nucleotidyltransferase/uncharacterized protein (UPF0332 family)